MAVSFRGVAEDRGGVADSACALACLCKACGPHACTLPWEGAGVSLLGSVLSGSHLWARSKQEHLRGAQGGRQAGRLASPAAPTSARWSVQLKVHRACTQCCQGLGIRMPCAGACVDKKVGERQAQYSSLFPRGLRVSPASFPHLRGVCMLPALSAAPRLVRDMPS